MSPHGRTKTLLDRWESALTHALDCRGPISLLVAIRGVRPSLIITTNTFHIASVRRRVSLVKKSFCRSQYGLSHERSVLVSLQSYPLFEFETASPACAFDLYSELHCSLVSLVATVLKGSFRFILAHLGSLTYRCKCILKWWKPLKNSLKLLGSRF